MCPLFDKYASMAVSSVITLMGEPAIWLADDGQRVPGKVLFKDPTEPLQVGDSEGYEYRVSTATAEYYEGTFPGLKPAVDAEKTEYLEVRGQTYLVTQVSTKFDGKIYVAHLEPHE